MKTSLNRQPGSSIEEFTNCIDNMFITQNCSLYLCGDLSINLLNYDNRSGTMFFVDQLITMSSFPQINKPTHITHDCHSIIDNISTNLFHEKMHCGILIDDTSDYLPLFCITCHKVKRKQKMLSHRMKNHERLRMMNRNLSLKNWHSVYKAVNVDEVYDNFFDIFMKHYNISCPIVKVVWKNDKPIKAWFTKGLINA